MQQKWNRNFDGEPMTDIPQKFLNAGCDVYMVMQLRHDEKIFDERFASMRELSESVIEKLKLLTDAEFAELEFPLD
ncbi:transposon-transfer assisting family protein [Faecalibacterium prausnitzii]|jgi:hypothetical protein|uniref:transposon-transfer assisting family protein n=1 Tax=Faecalibacterium prausnitzii TaxID=853 RepID=UPI001CBCB911|nr:transposon-transfer assisting family protein [Faecalibacterium prausnitzii]